VGRRKRLAENKLSGFSGTPTSKKSRGSPMPPQTGVERGLVGRKKTAWVLYYGARTMLAPTKREDSVVGMVLQGQNMGPVPRLGWDKGESAKRRAGVDGAPLVPARSDAGRGLTCHRSGANPSVLYITTESL